MVLRTVAPHEWRIVDRVHALHAGLEEEAFRREAHLIENAVAIRTVAVWSEQELGGGWIAAYRLVSEGGKPAVAELRIFPDRWARGKRPAGGWAGDFLDLPPIPPGGLSATVMRRVRLAEPLRDSMARLTKHLGSPILQYVFHEQGPLSGVGEASQRRSTRQPRISDVVLARLARAYLEAESSVRAVAKQAGLKESTVRGRILMAQKRGLILRSGKRGAASGRLTPRAQALLRRRSR